MRLNIYLKIFIVQKYADELYNLQFKMKWHCNDSYLIAVEGQSKLYNKCNPFNKYIFSI